MTGISPVYGVSVFPRSFSGIMTLQAQTPLGIAPLLGHGPP